MKKLLAMAALLATGATSPALATAFNFSQTIGTNYAFSYDQGEYIEPFLISGTFDGDAVGNIISNISNVTLVINGVAVSTPIYTGRYEGSTFVSGDATLSFDGTANNALFINSHFPEDSSYTAYYYSVTQLGGDAVYNLQVAATNSYTADSASTLLVTAAEVPEPAMLGLFGMGAIGLGLSRRRRAA